MKTFLTFWKRDIINKLIVVTSVTLFLGITIIAILIIRMPQGRSLGDVFNEFYPSSTPTFDLNALLTQSAMTLSPQTSTVAPTLFLSTFTASPEFTPTQAPTIPTDTPTTLATPTIPTPIATLASSTLSPMPFSQASMDCIPPGEWRTGKVLEALDGNTVRVLLDDGLIYVVRYIGISAPVDKLYGTLAMQKNLDLVYRSGREISLIGDAVDKDDKGRLLRYVVIGNIFVNLEMVRSGFGTVEASPSNSSCAPEFADAEQTARSAQLGIWSGTPTPKP